MDLRLDGKRVILTAGAAGIGRVTLKTFVDAGAEVFVCDVDDDALNDVRQHYQNVGVIHADVADPDDVDRLFETALDRLGGLDILLNNAGIAGPTAAVEEVDLDDWRKTLDINITGQFLCAKRAVPHIKAAGGGSIVNLSSAAGRFGFPLRSPYAASKWAVVGFTKSLAIELGPSKIRVNAICPGAVAGERIDRVIQAKADARGVSFGEMYQHYANTASMQTMIAPEDIANMMLFICSDAGHLVSGQILGVDGNIEYLR